MKKTLIAAALSLLCIGANAQEAFKHLSVGLEAGTTGVGLEVAVPVITDHLVLTAGYNTLPFSKDINVSNTDIICREVNGYIANSNSKLEAAGLSQRFESLPADLSVPAKAYSNLNAFKAMLEYYPVAHGSFHIVAGIYAGGETLAYGKMDLEQVWDTYVADRAISHEIMVENALNGTIPDARFNADGHSYKLNGPALTANIDVAKVRPYLGVGFGKTFPDSHIGFQFDLGAWYHGTPAVNAADDLEEIQFNSSYNAMNLDLSLLRLIKVYPQVSLRMIYRIF